MRVEEKSEFVEYKSVYSAVFLQKKYLTNIDRGRRLDSRLPL